MPKFYVDRSLRRGLICGMGKPRYSFYEFFAGGGMARAGLGESWGCKFANDFDAKKVATYAANWGKAEIELGDIGALEAVDLPGRADLAWASFPCQDLSLAGSGAGLRGERSGSFWSFWKLIEDLSISARSPSLIVLENVCGALTSHGGRDFAAICSALRDGGYRYGALVIDAVHFLPQSRPRLFIIAVRDDVEIPGKLTCAAPEQIWHGGALVRAHDKLPMSLRRSWCWWSLPVPEQPRNKLSELLEDEPSGVGWHDAGETRRLLSMMSKLNKKKVQMAKRIGSKVVGTIYKRTRPDEEGQRVQRAEVRFDEVSGCLRTPGGGSSRQTIIVVEGRSVRTRLISARETARLMGLKDSYVLPEAYNEAYHLTGDGVAVPVVSHLGAHLLKPLARSARSKPKAVAVA